MHCSLGHYTVASSAKGIEIMAFLMQGDCGSADDGQGDKQATLARWYATKFLLPIIPHVEHARQPELVEALRVKWRAVRGVSALDAQRSFIAHLKRECPQYGGRFFTCSFRVKNNVDFFFRQGASAHALGDGEVMVGINGRGVHVIINHKRVISHEISNMEKWMCSVVRQDFCRNNLSDS